MNTLLTDLAPAIINHPDLPMGQAIALEQDAHTKSILADEVRAKRIPDPVETPKGWSQHETEDFIIGYRIGYEDALQAVLKLLEAKE